MLERARSLSPEKQSPAAASSPRTARPPPPNGSAQDITSPPPLSVTKPLQSLSQALEDKPDLSAPQETSSGSSSQKAASRPEATDSLPESPTKASTSLATAPVRAPTLSWQQRPSGLRGPRTRPASFLERREPIRHDSHSPKSPATDEEPSKADITKSLSTRDPSWFRQTADRGTNSAALRRSHAEHAQDTPAERRQLHGLSNTINSSNQDVVKPSSLEASVSEPPSFLESVQSTNTTSDADPTMLSESSTVTSDERCADRASSQPIDYGNDEAESRIEDSVRSQSLTPGDRSSSPTKGMGGFVQSAMLRRSDSINKRWNVSTIGGLGRQNSSAGSASGRPGSRDRAANPPVGIPRIDQVNTFRRPDPSERNAHPGSAHNDAMDGGKGSNGSANKSGFPDRTRSKTLSDPSADPRSGTKTPEQSLQSSPSKRWSPQKSSWLESALSKPDTPKAKAPTSSQPAWLSDLQKNRQQRQSKDLGNSVLVQPDNVKVDLWGQPARPTPPEKRLESNEASSAPAPKPKPARLSDGLMAESPTAREGEGSRSPVESRADTKTWPPLKVDSSQASIKEKPTVPVKREPSAEVDPPRPGAQALSSPDSSKDKPETPPKKDFRSQLRPRPQPPTKPNEGQPEFLNAAGKLKRTETQRFVAPDVLGDNIRRGKAGLTVTGGPQRNQRRDEFKESLIQQKERMKEKAAEPEDRPAVPKKPEPPIHEALAKRQALGRNDSNANVMSMTSPEKYESAGKSTPSTTPLKEELSESDRSVSPPTVSAKLSSRFNPAIASVIARGPPSPPKDTGSMQFKTAPWTLPAIQSAQPHGDAGTSRPLEHKTKARARGPKRRLPKALNDTTSPAARSSSPPAESSPRLSTANKPPIKSSSRNVSLNMNVSEETGL